MEGIVRSNCHGIRKAICARYAANITHESCIYCRPTRDSSVVLFTLNSGDSFVNGEVGASRITVRTLCSGLIVLWVIVLRKWAITSNRISPEASFGTHRSEHCSSVAAALYVLGSSLQHRDANIRLVLGSEMEIKCDARLQ